MARYGRRKRVKYELNENVNRDIVPGLHQTRVLTLPDNPAHKVSTMEFSSLGQFREACKSITRQWHEGDTWSGGADPCLGYHQALDTMSQGLDSFIKPSDELIDKLERILPEFHLEQWQRVFDVVGALPNVPAFLTGEPLTMIRRKRVANQAAPLTIFVDLICTVGVPNSYLFKRGAAILALTRILAIRRPVTLYLGMMADKNGDAYQCSITTIPVDTAPLDLARAAYMFAHGSFNRGMIYKYAMQHADYRGIWAWMNSNKHRDLGQSVCKTVFGTDVLYIPPLMSQDADYHVVVNEPERWIKERVERYGMSGLSDD